MATKYGKELRKLRVDMDETMHGMAKRLEISISYLSAIESGSRKIPEDMTAKLIEKYRLPAEKAGALRLAEAESSKDVNIDLSRLTIEQRKLAFALSRKLNDISDEECISIINKIS